MKHSTSWILVILLLSFNSCNRWDFDKKAFPKCTKPSAIINYSANQLLANFSLTSLTGTIDKVEWFYGDGKTSTGNTTQYSYGSSGNYTVIVQLTNKCGDLTTLTTNIQVTNVTLPTVTTLDPKNVKASTATLGIAINSFGNGTVSRYGVCYSKTDAVPATDNSLYITSSQTASLNTIYNLDVSALSPNTLYYSRAFCQNSAGTAYGVVKTFQTGGLPSVTTILADNVSSTKASLSLKIDELGNPALSRYGVMFSSSSPDPGRTGLYNFYYNDTNGNVSGLINKTISFNIEGLSPNTLYYYRAYATNSLDTFYGQVYTVTTPSVVSLDLGLVVYLPLNASAIDKSANNFVTTMWGVTTNLGATDRKGVANGAMNFNGVDNYIALAENTLIGTPAMSVSFWVKPSNLTGKTRMSIVGKTAFANSQGEQYNYSLNFSTNQLFTYAASIKQNSNCVTPGQNWRNMAVGSFSTSGWQHMVFTFENGTGRLYTNGALSSSASDYPSKIIDNCSGGNLRIGAWWKDQPDYYQGSLDEVRLYNRAISVEEVKALYNQ